MQIFATKKRCIFVNDQELHDMMTSCGMRPSEVKVLIDVLDTDNDGDMESWTGRHLFVIFFYYSRMRSEGSRFIWGFGGEAVFAESCVYVRNRSQPFATVRNRPQPFA